MQSNSCVGNGYYVNTIYDVPCSVLNMHPPIILIQTDSVPRTRGDLVCCFKTIG